MRFQNKQIVLGLTGGIAIYKAAGLLRRLVREEGASVQVVMTAAAQQFMTPLIFETFSGRPVITTLFGEPGVATRHVDLARTADLVLVCPATANMVAKAAAGIADDFLSTLILAAGSKTVFALAMNDQMYANPITGGNIEKLRALGYGIIEPEAGELACLTSGRGRLADESVILAILDARLNGQGLLRGQRVVVTAGPTREALDAVRFVSNPSTGKMGYALAEIACREQAQTVLISGPTNIAVPHGVTLHRVTTALEMQKALHEQAANCDYLFMAAAVEDIVPQGNPKVKLKKTAIGGQLAITIAPDLLKGFRKLNRKACVVGFSVEMEDGRQRSLAKLHDKQLDFIVWNDPRQPGAAFGCDTNQVTLLAADGREWNLAMDSKRRIAEQIIQTVINQERGRRG